jgi:hypothetical protein
MTTTHESYEKLAKAFNYWYPEEAKRAFEEMGITINRKTIHVRAAKHVIDKPVDNTITVDDVIIYYLREARNITSGIRTIAGIHGDWRQIDNLAKTCLEIYKVLKNAEVKKYAKYHGMELKN